MPKLISVHICCDIIVVIDLRPDIFYGDDPILYLILKLINRPSTLFLSR